MSGVGARGEAILTVEGTEYPILFTNRALADAERATGKSIMTIARATERGEIGINDVAQLLYVGIEHSRRERRAGGRAYTINDAWHILDKLGLALVAEAVFTAVANVLSYGQGGEDELPPAS